MRTSILALVAAIAPLAAAADEWPSETIRIVVGFTLGGSSDLVARLLAPHLSEALGTDVIVENMPGAASTIAAAKVAETAPDGYTFFLSNVSEYPWAQIRPSGVAYPVTHGSLKTIE